MTKDELLKLAEEVCICKQRVLSFGVINRSHLSLERQARLDTQYMVLEDLHHVAYSKYFKALQKYTDEHGVME